MNLFSPEGAAIRPMRLVHASVAQALLDLPYEALYKRVDEGNPQWVFNVTSGQGRYRNLRFWAEELMDPSAVRRAELPDVVNKIIGTNRPKLATWEVAVRLGINRQMVLALVWQEQLSGPRVGRRQFVARESLSAFLMAAWLINLEKRAKTPQDDFRASLSAPARQTRPTTLLRAAVAS